MDCRLSEGLFGLAPRVVGLGKTGWQSVGVRSVPSRRQAFASPEPHSAAGGTTSGVMVAGIDGCAGGWVVVTVEADGGGSRSIRRVDNLTGVVADLDRGRLGAVAIVIPIGLPEKGSRRCDLAARKLIGPRRNSVFSAPFRSVLGALTYEDAAIRCRAVSGKSLTLQAFGILPKIAEVDRLMTPDRQRHLVEVHPEVSFTVLAGAPMSHNKASPDGRAERLLALGGAFSDVDLDAQMRVRGTSPDDILDAFAAAWSARRWLAGRHIQLGRCSGS